MIDLTELADADDYEGKNIDALYEAWLEIQYEIYLNRFEDPESVQELE